MQSSAGSGQPGIKIVQLKHDSARAPRRVGLPPLFSLFCPDLCGCRVLRVALFWVVNIGGLTHVSIRRRRFSLSVLACLFLLAIVIANTACGGGSSGTPPPPKALPSVAATASLPTGAGGATESVT